MLSASVVIGTSLIADGASAWGGAANACQPSTAKRINQQDVRSIRCVLQSSKVLRESAIETGTEGLSQCRTEEKANEEDQVWEPVEQAGSDLVSDSGPAAAAEGDGNEASALERYKANYQDGSHELQLLQKAIRFLKNAQSYGLKFKEYIETTGEDLQSHDCAHAAEALEAGAHRRDNEAFESETKAETALGELAGPGSK